MKHNLSKNMLCLALALLVSQPLLAQSGVLAPRIPASPVPPKPATIPPSVSTRLANKPVNIDLKLPELRLADIKIKNLDCRLAKLDHTLSNLEVKIAPKIAAMEKDIELAFSNLDPEIEFNVQQNFKQPDPMVDMDYVQAAEKSKKISKTYPVGSKDKLSINNQYGQVNVQVWDKKEIKVNVEIKAFEASDSKAEELLNNVSISESRQGDLISFKTNFDKSNMNWWSRTKNGKEEKRGVQINYTVYMPSKNPLDITNRYGSTTIADFDGPVNINSSYGSFTAEKLDNPANRIKVSYGSAAMESFSSGMLDVSYGSLKLTNADKLNSDIRYSSAKIGRLTSGGNIDVSYGSCKIEEMDKSVKNLVINSSYSGFTMGIDDAANFNFDVTVSYAGFNYNEDRVNITSKTPDENAKGWNPTKNYKGTYGKGSDSRVIIKSNYGGVKFL